MRGPALLARTDGVRALLALALAAAFALADARADAPDIDAVVHIETHQVTSAGVTRTESWRERLVRRGDNVWTERLRAPGAARHDAHAGHRHFDFETAARWLRRDARGALDLRFVDREGRSVIAVPPAEYEAVGFDGRFDAAASIVPPGVVARMPVVAREGEAEWHAERRDGWSHRVLWSPARRLALRVESERDDAAVRRVVRVEPGVPQGPAPWAGVGVYAQRTYDDLMD